MQRMRLPRWAVGAGLAAVVAGSGLITAGVSAATPSGSTVDSPATFVSDLAGHLGISTATLQSALRQTELDRVQTLLSNGRISAAQAQRMDGRIQSAALVPLWGAFTGHPGREHQVRRAPLGGVLPGAASYLGMTVAQLRADLANGQSLAAIANRVSGKSAAGLQAALLADAQGRLGSLVTQGKLSAAQQQARLTRLGQALPHLLARTGRMARRAPLGGVLPGAASYLGMTVPQVRADLANGQSLAAIANGVSGKSAAGLQAALLADAQGRLGSLVTQGKLSAAQEQARLTRLGQALPHLLARTGWMARRAPLGGVLPGAASYLGMTVAQLRADLVNGQSLAAIANGVSGKSAAGLQAALLADAQGRLGSLVTQGKLSAAQEQARLTRLGQALPHLLARTGWARRGPERPMRGRDAADGNSVSGGVAAAGTGASSGSINGGAGVSGTNSGPSAVPTTGTVPGSDA